jgi:hypothetical protein
VTAIIDGQSRTLETGDAMYFDAAVAHELSIREGDAPFTAW